MIPCSTAGLKMRDLLGYTTIVLIVSALVFGGTLLWFLRE